MHIYTEVTPNPASLKFVTEHTLLAQGTADFPTAVSAEGASPVAKRLFAYPFVGGVFIGRNFVTVTKAEDARWEDVIPVVKEEVKRALTDQEQFVTREDVVMASNESGDEVSEKIRNLIEEQVRPAVAMDGGDILYEGFEDGVVKLKLRGSCSGCPSSLMTLKAGIQSLLTRLVPEVKAVEAV